MNRCNPPDTVTIPREVAERCLTEMRLRHHEECNIEDHSEDIGGGVGPWIDRYANDIAALESALAAPQDARLEESYAHFNQAMQDLPNDKGYYAHLLVCSADRRKPAGTPGIGCVCHPKLREYMRVAAPQDDGWEYDLSKAPKDGDYILLSVTGTSRCAYFTPQTVCSWWDDVEQEWMSFPNGYHQHHQIIAWRPLPAPAQPKERVS